jgi:hypothetical protein
VDNIIYLNCTKYDCYWNILEHHPNNPTLNHGFCACREITLKPIQNECSKYINNEVARERMNKNWGTIVNEAELYEKNTPKKDR